jgi:hypothetical protein
MDETWENILKDLLEDSNVKKKKIPYLPTHYNKLLNPD